jgi:hypothetical protein
MKNLAIGLLALTVLVGGYAGLFMLLCWFKWWTIPILGAFILGLRVSVGNEGHNA